MNISITKNMIKKPPSDPKKAYVFVNDNKAICESVITVGFNSLYISGQENDFFFTDQTFCDFIRDISNTGTSILEYTFVLACYRKRTNDVIEEVLKNNMVPYKTGAYTLFKDKEYLAKYEKQGELEQALEAYVKRFEGKEAGGIDKLQFCRFGASGNVVGIHDLKIVHYLMETKCMFVIGRELYIYQNGCYFLDPDGIYIKSVIQGLIPDKYATYRALNAVYNLLIEQQDLQKTMEDINNYPHHWINFQNGMFDVKEMKLRKHDPKYLSVNQIPHDLDMDARKEIDSADLVLDKFLNQAIPAGDDRIMLWEYVGYSMTVDTCFQKMLIIRGVGGTGKSRVISLIQAICGNRNCSNISLHDLNQKFYPSMLYGKLLNTCADISSDALTAVDNIKKATGEDIMIYEKKGKDPQSFRSYAKLVFSANKIPMNLDEKTNAFYRRLLILDMNYKPEEPDRELDQKLQQEVKYAIWKAVGALKKLYDDGKFLESQNSAEQVEDLYRAADTVKAFLDECTERKEGSRIERKLLYETYVEYCKSYGRKEHSPNPFYKSLEEKGYHQKRTEKGRYILDLDLKGEDFIESEEGQQVFKEA